MKKKVTYEFKEEVGIIRDRNQITIPAEFKNIVKWLKKGTPVRIKLKGNKITIEPFYDEKKNC